MVMQRACKTILAPKIKICHDIAIKRFAAKPTSFWLMALDLTKGG